MSRPRSDLTAGPSTWLLVSSSASERIFSASKKKSCETSSGKRSSTSWVQCSECQRVGQSVLEDAQLLPHRAVLDGPGPADLVEVLLAVRRVAERQRHAGPLAGATPWWIDWRRNSSYARLVASSIAHAAAVERELDGVEQRRLAAAVDAAEQDDRRCFPLRRPRAVRSKVCSPRKRQKFRSVSCSRIILEPAHAGGRGDPRSAASLESALPGGLLSRFLSRSVRTATASCPRRIGLAQPLLQHLEDADPPGHAAELPLDAEERDLEVEEHLVAADLAEQVPVVGPERAALVVSRFGNGSPVTSS